MKQILTLAMIVLTSASITKQTLAEDKDKKADQVSVSTSAHSGINDTIKEQLQAIRERNDRIAFELNANDIQDVFEDPQSFMREIRRSKKSLYNHVDYKFLGSGNAEEKFHRVMLTDKYGKSSIAMFKMEQDDNGLWKTKDIIILMSDDGPV